MGICGVQRALPHDEESVGNKMKNPIKTRSTSWLSIRSTPISSTSSASKLTREAGGVLLPDGHGFHPNPSAR